MSIVRRESRNRVGIVWYDNEEEADLAGEEAKRSPGAEAANIGIIQVGRDTVLDRPGEYAVVTP